MKKEITLEMIEAQLAVIFQKLSELEEKVERGAKSSYGDNSHYLNELRKQAQKLIESK